jgi:hypothetical protein
MAMTDAQLDAYISSRRIRAARNPKPTDHGKIGDSPAYVAVNSLCGCDVDRAIDESRERARDRRDAQEWARNRPY